MTLDDLFASVSKLLLAGALRARSFPRSARLTHHRRRRWPPGLSVFLAGYAARRARRPGIATERNAMLDRPSLRGPERSAKGLYGRAAFNLYTRLGI